jgi:hydrogenase maturation factor
MKAGKLPHELLARLLERMPADPRVLLGPGIGRDAAAIDLGDGRVLVAKTDPVTFAAEQIGWYAVHVNANDIACVGADPRWFLATALLPEGAPESLAEQIFDQILSACAELGVVPVGGHTEITIGLDRPVIAGMMLGETTVERLVRSDGGRDGDHVLMTKAIAVEGTALLAREARPALEARGVDAATLDRAARLLFEPGISVVREARAACAATGLDRYVHALHDPTEGGLATAVWELATAAGLRVRIRREDVAVLPETVAFCEALAIDPLGLLASGSLLVAVAPQGCDAVREAIAAEGIAVACIGSLASRGSDVIIGARGEEPLPRFQRDELATILEALDAERDQLRTS